MTLIYAVHDGNTALVCADTQLSDADGTPNGSSSKVSIKRGCIVATYSIAPTENDIRLPHKVHARIAELPDGIAGRHGAAAPLANHIAALLWHVAAGCFVVGWDDAQAVIYRVERGQVTAGALGEVHSSRQNATAPNGIAVDNILEALRWEARTTAGVGGPFDVVTLRREV